MTEETQETARVAGHEWRAAGEVRQEHGSARQGVERQNVRCARCGARVERTRGYLRAINSPDGFPVERGNWLYPEMPCIPLPSDTSADP